MRSSRNLRLSPNVVLTVQEYKGIPGESQEITLRNYHNHLFSKVILSHTFNAVLTSSASLSKPLQIPLLCEDKRGGNRIHLKGMPYRLSIKGNAMLE